VGALSLVMTTAPRVLVYSERNAICRKWHALQYEFEDVGVETGVAELMAPRLRPSSSLSRVTYRVGRAAGRRRTAEAGLEQLTVERDYDLFVAFFAFPSDIPHISALRGWRRRCAKAICFIGEMYSHQLEENREHLERLRELGFNHVFTLHPRSAPAVSRMAGAPVEFMPLGVDAFRFSPYPHVPQRVVDLYQFGRRSEVTHAAALALAQEDDRFYLYDTVFNVPLEDYRAHRELIAHTMKRSRYFFAYRPSDNLERAREDDTLSSRYFEATAGGAILLGSRPDSPEYDETFPWPDAVITIPFEAHDLREILAELDAQPERLARARANNIVQTIRRHDWAYRWRRILQTAGLDVPPALAQRLRLLDELADLAEAESLTPVELT
jgi:Glycosyl transferases group 1